MSSNTPALPSDREVAATLLSRLAGPVLAAARGPGLAATMPVETAPDTTRDRRPFSALEAMGRLLSGLAPLLEWQYRSQGAEVVSLAHVHHLLAISTGPESPQRLDFTAGPQSLVDAAFLAQAVLRASGALWQALPAEVQDNLALSLLATRSIPPYFNNWLLFSAMIEAALCKMGLPWDRMRVDYALRQHEQWYAGDGLYSDGPHFRWDYYNGYVIQPMLRDILDAVGDEDKTWRAMRQSASTRMARYAVILERLIGPDGSFPPIGRSLAYRGAAFQPLAQLALHDTLPAGLPAGQVRAALMAVILRTLPESSFDTAGWLRLGLNGSQPQLAESYVSTGSLYLCSTVFLPLGLGPEAPFWSDPAEPWTQKRIWVLGEDLPRDVALDG